MQAPDVREHIAVRYQALGFSVIPLDTGDKRPHLGLLPGRQWSPYQITPASRAVVAAWASMNPQPNWGLVCGQVSHGLYCGDCDDPAFAHWVLAHAREPLFRNAWIVETGSGKAHIYFQSPTRLESHVWKPRTGTKVGDVRGDGRDGAQGSYMAVPPSIHPDTGREYRTAAGSFDSLPVIDNGEAFLAEILAAYRQEVPEGTPPPDPTSSRTLPLTLTSEERLRIQGHVKDLKLKQKIKDTLLEPGMHRPGSRHWANTQDDSRSGIDFAVVCELIRKGQTFEQVEQIFAATEVGLNRYLSREKGHSTGPKYLKLTYDNALKEVEQQRRNSRIAKGQNFEVLEATRLRHGTRNAVYHLTIQFNQPDREPVIREVDIPVDVLNSEARFLDEIFTQANEHPILAQNHMGKHNYPAFKQAISNMVTDDATTPVALRREGQLAGEIWRQIHHMMPRADFPPTPGEVHGIGWRTGNTFYLKLHLVQQKLQSMRLEFKHAELPDILGLIGEYAPHTHRWPGEHPEQMVTITLRQPSSPGAP